MIYERQNSAEQDGQDVRGLGFSGCVLGGALWVLGLWRFFFFFSAFLHFPKFDVFSVLIKKKTKKPCWS